jgi:zinc transport system permease protein
MEIFFLKIGLAAALLSILLAFYSFVVYFFRLAFLSIAVSHAVLAGIALGLFFRIDPTLSALLFSILIGWLIAFLKRKTGLTEDASIGIVLALSMAVGIVLIYLSGYQGNVLSYLFGSLMLISTTDLVALLLLSALTVFLFFRYREQLLFLCFDEETAYSSGVNTSLLYYTLVGLLSFLITFATKLVGVILTHALLVIPAAAAYQLFWHYPELIATGGVVSLLITACGLALSYLFDLPAGPSIVLTGGILFFAFSLVKFFKNFK